MTGTNRVETLSNENDDNGSEDEKISGLTQLARAHGAESRAAEQISEAVVRGKFRYNPSLGWMKWDGRRWDTDNTVSLRLEEIVRQYIDSTERDYRVRATFAEARYKRLMNTLKERLTPEQLVNSRSHKPKQDVKLIEEFGDDAEKLEFKQVSFDLNDATIQADMWQNFLSAGKISALSRLCRGMEGVVTTAAEFDAHPELLNCQNGVVNLRTGELTSHNPELLLTKMTTGDYIPGFVHPLWDKVLQSIDADALSWFQVRVGQSATGFTPDDDSICVCAGGGENGKTALMETIVRALGTYADLVSHRVLIAQPGQHPTELMDLRGIRFALMEETPEEGRLDPHQLKMHRWR
jgi:phage/plasmid-associated DNA primase